MAKFKAIRELALQDEDDEAAEMWDLASSIRKLAMEIQEHQELLGAAQADLEAEGQDLGCMSF